MINKICFILPELRLGGAEQNYIKVANWFSQKNDFQVFFFFKKKSNNFSSELNKKINKIYLYDNNFKNFFYIRKNLKNIKPNAVFTALSISAICVLVKFTIKNQFKLITRLATQITAQYNRMGIYNKFKFLLFIKLISFSNILVAQSKDMSNDLVKYIGIQKTKKIKVIYNPIVLEEILFKYNEEINLNKIKNNNFFYILFFGKFEKVKNIPLLIDFFKSLTFNKNKLRLILLGEGSEIEKLKNLISKISLTNSVEIIETAYNPFPYIKLADLIISTSYYEGYSNTLLESIIFEKLILVSDCPGGNKEILQDYFEEFTFKMNGNRKNIIDNMIYKFEKIIRNKNKNTNKINSLKSILIKRHDSNKIFREYEKLI